MDSSLITCPFCASLFPTRDYALHLRFCQKYVIQPPKTRTSPFMDDRDTSYDHRNPYKSPPAKNKESTERSIKSAETTPLQSPYSFKSSIKSPSIQISTPFQTPIKQKRTSNPSILSSSSTSSTSTPMLMKKEEEEEDKKISLLNKKEEGKDVLMVKKKKEDFISTTNKKDREEKSKKERSPVIKTEKDKEGKDSPVYLVSPPKIESTVSAPSSVSTFFSHSPLSSSSSLFQRRERPTLILSNRTSLDNPLLSTPLQAEKRPFFHHNMFFNE